MKALTRAQLIGQHGDELLAARRKGWEDYEHAHKQSLHLLKLQTAAAATKLMEEAGRIMSRAGYMIGKINGDNSR